MGTVLHDLRFALRSLRSSKGVALVATVTLAIGIATVTTIFSFVNTALFRPPPYPDADRIVALGEERPNTSSSFSALSVESIEALRRGTRSFERFAAYTRAPATLTGVERPERLAATRVDTALLPLLGFVPQRGRSLTREEIVTGAPVVLIGDATWRARFGASDAIVGQTLRLDGIAHTIVGVAPPGFGFPERAQIFLPLVESSTSGVDPAAESYSALGMLREGVSREQARAEVSLIGQRLTGTGVPHLAGMSLVVRDGMIDRGVGVAGPLALTFLGAALCVLLIACTNVGNLMLARAAERRIEMAVRASLGASRARLVRQSLTESAVLGAVAGAAGCVLSIWAVSFALSRVPTANFPTWLRFGVDGRVLAFAIAVSVLVIVAFGLPPALRGSRLDPMAALKDGGGSITRAKRVTRGARRGVVVELALAVSLFVAAVLLWQTHRRLATVDPGYDAEQVLETVFAFDQTRHPDAPARLTLLTDIEDRLTGHSAIAGVATRGTFAGVITAPEGTQASGRSRGDSGDSASMSVPADHAFYLPGNQDVAVDRWPAPQIWDAVVSHDFFEVMGIPLLRGRSFQPSDGPGSEPVAIVSEQLARALWSGDALGERFRIGREGTTFTVVGIARDISFTTSSSRGLDAGPKRSVYYSNRQVGSHWPELLVRARGGATLLVPEILAAVRATDPELVVHTPEPLAEGQRNAMTMTSVVGGFIGTFALAALVLATIGIYGVLAYGVADRTREIGIRMALGGDARAVIRLIVGEGMRFVALGLAIGVALSMAFTPLLRRFIWGASVHDPKIFAVVLAAFGGVALVACWLPARRATRVEPIVALRAE